MNDLSSTFRALKYKNFRLFFPGLIISQIGIWIQNTVIFWLIYEITKSPFLLGIITFLNSMPFIIFVPFSGIIIDKYNRHKLLFIVQILFIVQALLMTLVMFFKFYNLPIIVLLGIFLNCVASFDIPLRQSSFVCLIDDKKDLDNAISLNSSCFNIAKLLGPAIAGLLIVHTSLTICFLINFLCLIPMIFLITKMSFDDKKNNEAKNKSILENLKDGFNYAKNKIEIRTSLFFVTIFSILGMSYPILTPILTKDVLGSDADVLGYLMGMVGIGALFASFSLASLKSIEEIKKKLFLGTIIFAISYITIGLSNAITISLLAMFGVGVGTIYTITSNLTLIQLNVDDKIRGRIMSIYAICFVGTTSLSNFIAGTITQIGGIKITFITLGIIVMITGLSFSNKVAKLKYITRF